VSKYTFIRYHKGCCSILTVGQWPWKLESAKECVTTHRPNGAAPKMDDAEMWILMVTCSQRYLGTSRRVSRWRRSLGVTHDGAAVSTDLGCSSKYSAENAEDRSGEGFRVNSD
jgi:hypothetical protein